MTLFTPRGWDCTPSTYRLGGCAWRFLRASSLAVFVLIGSTVVATIAGQWIHRVDPRLLRAACASKTSADVGRSLLGMTSIPRGSPIVRQVYEATEAEMRAWADTDARCE